MSTALPLIWHNLKKAKGQYLSFGVIVCLTAFILNCALVLAFQTPLAYDQRAEELNTADINVVIPQVLDSDDIADKLAQVDGVARIEQHDALFLSVTVREFADSDFDMNAVFYPAETTADNRKLNYVEFTRGTDKATGNVAVAEAPNAVFIPLYVAELGGFPADGRITFTIDDVDTTYDIGGIASEMQYGNYGTGLIGFYLGKDAYDTLQDDHEDARASEYSIALKPGADLNQAKGAIGDTLSDENAFALSIIDRETAKQTRTMVCTLLVVIFLALAFIILVVSIFLANFKIKSSIVDEIVQMGVLKALGYTSGLIILATVIPYVLIGALAAIIGAVLSYAALPALAHVMAVQSGFSYSPHFDGVAYAITVLVPAVAICLFAYLSSRKIRRLEPIHAIRRETAKTGAAQSVLLFIVAFGIMVLLSFAGTLFYNVVVQPENFHKTLSDESPSVIFTARDGKLAELEYVLSGDARVDGTLEYATTSVKLGKDSVTTFVSEDFSKARNDICYEGANPSDAHEVAIGSALAEDHPIGSRIELSHGDRKEEYSVVGYVQSVNAAGNACELTKSGIERLGGKIDTLYVYLADTSASGFIENYERDHGELLASSIDYDRMRESTQSMYAGIVAVVAVVVLLIAAFMVLLVLYVVTNTVITRRKQEFGIYKAVGYTSGQLIVMTARSLVPPIAAGALASAIAGIWYVPAINAGIFGLIGAVKNHFDTPLFLLFGLAAGFVALAFLISVLLARPIRKITAYSLLRE